MTFRKLRRNRALLAIAMLIVIAAGLASRNFPALLPAALGKYPGDALWALMVYLGLAIIWPNVGSLRLAALALGISYLVELSQLYQAPWINALRDSMLGRLALGSGFDLFDLCAYAVGAAGGVLLDFAFAGGHTESSSARDRRSA